MKNGQNILARADQFRNRMVPEDIKMEGESGIDEQAVEEGTREFSHENEQSIDESEEENELRPWSSSMESGNALRKTV